MPRSPQWTDLYQIWFRGSSRWILWPAAQGGCNSVGGGGGQNLPFLIDLVAINTVLTAYRAASDIEPGCKVAWEIIYMCWLTD